MGTNGKDDEHGKLYPLVVLDSTTMASKRQLCLIHNRIEKE